jgi:hypothetical protein
MRNIKWIEFNCRYCSNYFKVKEWDAEKRNPTYCSNKCYLDYMKSLNIDINCDYCNKLFTARKNDIEKRNTRFCSRKCCNLYKKDNSNIEAKFWSSVDKINDEDSCWNYSGHIDKSTGYGSVYIGTNKKGKTMKEKAHRYSFLLENGYLPKGNNEVICHKCDNRKCVRPSHLFHSTQKGNVEDMVKKGRDKHFTKLTESQVLEIREKYKHGNISQSSLANQYGTEQTNICQIVNKKTWKHLL